MDLYEKLQALQWQTILFFHFNGIIIWKVYAEMLELTNIRIFVMAKCV